MEELIIKEWQLLRRLTKSIPVGIDSIKIKFPNGNIIAIVNQIEES